MIEITNYTDFAVDKRVFLGVAKKVLKGENRETESVSVAFVVPKDIHQLNKKYRNKNKPTDVLSFENNSQFPGGQAELIICPAVIRQKAKEQGVNDDDLLMRTFIHGLLHILGYDHEKSPAQAAIMKQKEIFYNSSIK